MAPTVFHCEQGTPEWFAIRGGIPTASNFAAVLAKGEGKTRKSYLYKLLAERFTGEPADNFQNDHMIRGREMEAEARDLYALTRDVDLERVGFIRNGGVGCSPDSLIGDDGMLEIKTKMGHLLLEVLEADRLPPEHIAQVQGQLWVAEREFCDFVAYWPRLPLFVKRVTRDEEYIAKLSLELDRFCTDLDALTAKMVARGATLAERADAREAA